MLWCKREEAVQKRRVLFESRPWYGKWKLGGVLSMQVDLQITSRVRLVGFVHCTCINFTTGADLTISVYNSVESGRSSHYYMYSKGKKAQLLGMC